MVHGCCGRLGKMGQNGNGSDPIGFLRWKFELGPRLPMKMKKIISGVVFSLVAIFILDLVGGPFVNPRPDKMVTMYGRFPFEKGYQLSFSQEAYATTILAGFICGGFGIIRGPSGLSCRGGKRLVEMNQLDCCNYEVKVFRDYYLPGLAGWVLGPLSYRILAAGAVGRTGGSGVPVQSGTMNCVTSNAKFRDRQEVICIFATNGEAVLSDPKVTKFRLDFVFSENAIGQ